MVAGDSVKIYKRTAQGADWGDPIKTWDTVGEQSLYTPFGLSNITSIQFKIILNKNAEFLSASII